MPDALKSSCFRKKVDAWKGILFLLYQIFMETLFMKEFKRKSFTNCNLTDMVMSSIVNEVIKTISSLFIFLQKDLKRAKSTKAQNKQFLPPSKFLCTRKIVAFVVFCSLVFVLLVGFCLWHVVGHLKIFVQKSRLEITLITSFTILLTCTPINSPYGEFVCTLSFLCVIICENLFFLWEYF